MPATSRLSTPGRGGRSAGQVWTWGRWPPGATSRWHSLPAVLPHYRKTRVQLPRRQVIGTLLDGALMPGSYTLVCTLEAGGLRVVAVREPVPDE